MISPFEVKKTPGGLFYAVYMGKTEVPDTRETRKYRATAHMKELEKVMKK